MEQVSMQGLIIEYIRKKTDKRGEYAFVRIKSANGITLFTSEKYKNRRFAEDLAVAFSNKFQMKFKEIDQRKKK